MFLCVKGPCGARHHRTVSAMIVVLLTKPRGTKEILYHKSQILLSVKKSSQKLLVFIIADLCLGRKKR